MNYSIEISNVSKKFKSYQGKNVTLKEKLLYYGKQQTEDVWVLQNINLNLLKGSTVGLIGRNGSGKSTLLKLISKILYPTQGEIRVHGKISTLLELGAGFHRDFTGRENVYLNGSILGFSRKEIQSKMNSIIAFSELEGYIDQPVRNYSSGMYMRLGFAVAIHVEPDILLMDEILAVGDHAFQEKCIEQIMRLKQSGRTIIFVSHSGDQVKKICDQAIWLEQGRIKMTGPSREVVDKYEGVSVDRAQRITRIFKDSFDKETLSTLETWIKTNQSEHILALLSPLGDSLLDHAEVQYTLACCYQHQLRFESALLHFNRALKLGFSRYKVKLNRSMVYLELGLIDEASRDASDCLGCQPKGSDEDSLIQHIKNVNSKLEVAWVKTPETKLTDNQAHLPNFLIIGAQKSGTTSLHHYLIQHPSIRSGVIKEVHYFDEQYDFGIEWYKRHFPEQLSTGEITGESSPYYLFHPQVPQRVKDTLPAVKMIILLRNPIDRAYSHYKMMEKRGLEKLSFADAVRNEQQRINEDYAKMVEDPSYNSPAVAHFSYLKRGVYVEQLEQWFRRFPQNQFLIMNSEQFYSDPEKFYKQALNFLGLPEWELADYKVQNDGVYEQEIDSETLYFLKSYFATYNQQLYQLLGEVYDWS